MRKNQCVLFATFPKAGWNWTVDILSYSVIKYFKGKYDIKYVGEGTLKAREQKPYTLFHPADSRLTGKPKLKQTFPFFNIDYCLHSHGAWKESPLSFLDEAKTVFITRDIPTNLFSYYKSRRQGMYSSFEECLEQYALDRVINFYNSWGEYIEKHKNHMIVHYEDYKTKPVETYTALIKFAFSIDVPPSLIEEALQFYSFENQKKREFAFCEDSNKHFHYKGAISYKDEISPATYDYIKSELRKRLKHTFGYSYQ